MACQVLFEFRIKDGCEDKLKQHLKEILPDTRNYPGCLNLHMVQDMEDPAKVVLIELWETKEAYDKYLAWRTERGDVTVLEEMFENPQLRQFNFWGA